LIAKRTAQLAKAAEEAAPDKNRLALRNWYRSASSRWCVRWAGNRRDAYHSAEDVEQTIGMTRRFSMNKDWKPPGNALWQ